MRRVLIDDLGYGRVGLEAQGEMVIDLLLGLITVKLSGSREWRFQGEARAMGNIDIVHVFSCSPRLDRDVKPHRNYGLTVKRKTIV